MQKIIDPTEKKSSPETAAFYLNKIYQVLGHDPWADLWDNRLNATQKHVACLLAGIDTENGQQYEAWAEFTRAECEAIQRAAVKLTEFGEDVRRAVGANREAVAA